jgi:hypothetical protein
MSFSIDANPDEGIHAHAVQDFSSPKTNNLNPYDTRPMLPGMDSVVAR